MAEENGSASGSSDAESDPSNDAGRSSAKVATTQMCPLDLRFSQRKMRNLFADGKLLSDSVDLVRPIRRTPSEVEIYGAEWKLEAPFPPIEVLRWRCKLRDETTGRPMIDPKTGDEMFDDEESWFTLDNRRLCCLQKAAVKLWPERCTCDVVAEIPKGARRMREIRKFRTLDAGKSVMVGSKVDGVPFTQWAWRAEVSKKLGGGGGGKGAGGKSRKGRGRGGGAGSGATAEDADHTGYGESGADGGGYQAYKGGKKGGGKKGGKGYGYSGGGGGKGKGKKGRDQTASRAGDAWVNQDPAIVAASASAAVNYSDYYAEEAAESGYGYDFYYNGGKAASGKGSKSRGRGGYYAYDAAKGGNSDHPRKGGGKKGGGRKGGGAV